MLAVSLVTFVLVSVSPIDPVQANVGQTAYINMSEAKRAQLAEYWGVNTPLWERYANWFVDLLHGDLGTSLRFNAPVIDVIATRAVNSLALMATAWAVSGVLGFALGILAGANRGRLIDRIVKGYCFLLASVPTFWLGLLFLIVFSVQLGWFPFGFSVPIGVSAADVTFADALHHLALPALTLSVIGVANIALHTREKTIDVLESDYVQFARARGAKRVVITDVSDYRLSKARECGIERTLNVAREPLDGKIAELFGDEGYQVAFECAGVESSVRSLMATVEKGGDVVIVGVHAKDPAVSMFHLGEHELNLIGSMMYRHEDYLKAVEEISAGRIRLAPLVSNRFPLEKYREAYEFIDANRETCMKVLIDLEDGKA